MGREKKAGDEKGLAESIARFNEALEQFEPKFIVLFKKEAARIRAESLTEIRRLWELHGIIGGTVTLNPEELRTLTRFGHAYCLLPGQMRKQLDDVFRALQLFGHVPELREGIVCLVKIAARDAQEKGGQAVKSST